MEQMRWDAVPSHPRYMQAVVLVDNTLKLYVQLCAPDDGRRNRLQHVERL